MNKSNVYRIHHDSSHFVGIKYFKRPFMDDDLELKNYESEFTKTFGKPFSNGKRKKKNNDDEIWEEAYLKALEHKKKDRVNVIKEYLLDHNIVALISTIEKFLKTKEKNLFNRIDRFRKKALLNKWNYFVTITYDDSKHDEVSFKRSLKKCLANLHTRSDYKYMGVFERSKTGRLHFHALMFIPRGEMRGTLKTITDYSTSDKKMRVTTINSFFEKRFGRNDFTKIDTMKLMRDSTIRYLLKYIAKSDEPIFYSRGIPTYLYVDLPEEEVITQFGDILVKYVFFDNILQNYESKPIKYHRLNKH